MVGCQLVCNFGLLGFFLNGFGISGGGLGCDHFVGILVQRKIKRERGRESKK